MESWSSEIIKLIDSKLENVKDRDIRFFRIAEFKRNIERVEQFSQTCPHCQKEQINIKEAVESVDEAIGVPGKARRNYDRLISRLSKHIQNEHGFYPPFHFSYLHALYGLVAGFVLGFGLMKLIPEFGIELLFGAISVGLVASYITGSIKDRRIREQKRIM
ncbi:hypothetical protein [Maribellus sp. YY47]|uniref:hypothetical protein n=1 Tax=Maribellus sp. YY47 TaxID=2929486 RepID=UPI002001181B|nr:hypothetical protein [Maribellus sp. YY47]MCK3685783.1 hypothetical protein [Maribellus sp. YY47]